VDFIIPRRPARIPPVWSMPGLPTYAQAAGAKPDLAIAANRNAIKKKTPRAPQPSKPFLKIYLQERTDESGPEISGRRRQTTYPGRCFF